MNTYKKTILALGIVLVIPQISNALDAKGEALANNLKVVYGTTISASHLSNPNADFGKWDNFIKSVVYPYVAENSRLAGIKDTLLIKSLDILNTYSAILTNHLQTVRGGLILKGENQIHEQILIRVIAALKSIKDKIDTTQATLRLEKYYVASKKNAQEILLIALDRVGQTTEKAIELLTAEVQKRQGR